MKTIRTILVVALLAGTGGGCALWQNITGTSAQEQNAAAAAETTYTAIAELATSYIKSGRGTPAQVAQIKAIDNEAYAEIVAARNAVAAGDNAAIAAALAALQQYESQQQTIVGVN